MLARMKENAQKTEMVQDIAATADAVGLAAVIVQDLKAKRIKAYESLNDDAELSRTMSLGGRGCFKRKATRAQC